MSKQSKSDRTLPPLERLNKALATSGFSIKGGRLFTESGSELDLTPSLRERLESYLSRRRGAFESLVRDLERHSYNEYMHRFSSIDFEAEARLTENTIARSTSADRAEPPLPACHRMCGVFQQNAKRTKAHLNWQAIGECNGERFGTAHVTLDTQGSETGEYATTRLQISTEPFDKPCKLEFGHLQVDLRETPLTNMEITGLWDVDALETLLLDLSLLLRKARREHNRMLSYARLGA